MQHEPHVEPASGSSRQVGEDVQTIDLPESPVADTSAPETAANLSDVTVDVQSQSLVDSDGLATDDLATETPSQRRAWGFVAFLASVCALAIAFDERPASPDNAATAAVMPLELPSSSEGSLHQVRPVEARLVPAILPQAEASDRSTERPAIDRSARDRQPVTFETKSVVTTEKAVAAVFVLNRSPPFNGRARVRWAARSGTADAAIDFSDASGTAVIADGQRKVALYVPLRNDLLKEGDETFKVCLQSPRHACSEATIRDDD